MASYLYTGPRPSRLMWLLALGGVLWLAALLAVSHAKITLDGSLGSRGPLAGPNYRINADMGQIRGGNLFHSFSEFHVPTRGSAAFTGPATIANILSRVTGGQPSAIDGLLRSEIAGANLFLLNPSGVMFGPNAQLDVKGSFHVSTADFLRLADGEKFFAHLGQQSVLTTAAPAAFGFLGNDQPLNLADTDLRRANLSGAHLEGAVLVGANLQGALLSDAHLDRTFLWGAHLEGAWLSRANLQEANLKDAHLEGANLVGAHLEEADLTNIHLEGADFMGAHLQRAKGLTVD
jgi:filamentous hemagglutinin family protein